MVWPTKMRKAKMKDKEEIAGAWEESVFLWDELKNPSVDAKSKSASTENPFVNYSCRIGLARHTESTVAFISFRGYSVSILIYWTLPMGVGVGKKSLFLFVTSNLRSKRQGSTQALAGRGEFCKAKTARATERDLQSWWIGLRNTINIWYDKNHGDTF